MTSFSFDSSLSADENIDRFFEHLKTTNPEFADLLKTHMETMLPLREHTQDRSARRVAFNKSITAALKPTDKDSGVDNQ